MTVWELQVIDGSHLVPVRSALLDAVLRQGVDRLWRSSRINNWRHRLSLSIHYLYSLRLMPELAASSRGSAGVAVGALRTV